MPKEPKSKKPIAGAAHVERVRKICAALPETRALSGNVVETERLILRRLSVKDAEFILELLNDPSFLRFIGDKGVRTLDDARAYVLNGPVQSYQTVGFGLYLAALKDSSAPIGICGLLKRDALEDVDIGFAFLPGYRGKGYAIEAARATLGHGKDGFGLSRIVAITNPDNEASIGLLKKLGFRFERITKLADDAPQVKLFAVDI